MKDDLSKLSTKELGQLFPIFLVNYNQNWIKLYQLEKSNIIKAIGKQKIVRIEHIGSTAIPGLCAKPTIDILIELMDITNCDLQIENLKKIDYRYIPKPENPPPHCMLAKGYSISGITGQTYHIHLRSAGEWDEIIFRDFLNKNPDTARQYGDLKRRLAAEYKNDREQYTNGKGEFVNRIIKLARMR